MSSVEPKRPDESMEQYEARCLAAAAAQAKRFADAGDDRDGPPTVEVGEDAAFGPAGDDEDEG